VARIRTRCNPSPSLRAPGRWVAPRSSRISCAPVKSSSAVYGPTPPHAPLPPRERWAGGGGRGVQGNPSGGPIHVSHHKRPHRRAPHRTPPPPRPPPLPGDRWQGEWSRGPFRGGIRSTLLSLNVLSTSQAFTQPHCRPDQCAIKGGRSGLANRPPPPKRVLNQSSDPCPLHSLPT